MDNITYLLTMLCVEHGLVMLKGGTEVEDMTFDEISHMKRLGDSRVPLIVKIGGPEARNDIRALKAIGTDGILAPMIESEYGLRNFVETIHDIYKDEKIPCLAINIETINAFHNLDMIFMSPYFHEISHVTIGRSDLSASMNMKNDDDEVMRITEHIVARARELGKITSVGGKITPVNAPEIRRKICPDRINTRHLMFDMNLSRDSAAMINQGLEFEIELYRAWSAIEPGKKDGYLSLIEATYKRMESNKSSDKRRMEHTVGIESPGYHN